MYLFPCFWKWLMGFPEQRKIMASPLKCFFFNLKKFFVQCKMIYLYTVLKMARSVCLKPVSMEMWRLHILCRFTLPAFRKNILGWKLPDLFAENFQLGLHSLCDVNFSILYTLNVDSFICECLRTAHLSCGIVCTGYVHEAVVLLC